MKDQTPASFAVVSAEQVRKTIEKIDHALDGKNVSKDNRQKLNYAKKNWPPNVERHAQQEAILKKRNRYSKTDTMQHSCA